MLKMHKPENNIAELTIALTHILICESKNTHDKLRATYAPQ